MTITVGSKALKQFSIDLLTTVNVPRNDAEIIVECLVESNLRGIDSHGVMRLSIYVPRFNIGAMNPKPFVSVNDKSNISAVVDGDNGIGHLTGTISVQKAINLAKDHGVGLVSTINSNHFGAAGYFSTMVADNKMIGFSASNTCPSMPAIGGKTPVVGNGPFSVAIPELSGRHICLDISTSAGAYGKILIADRAGTKIPEGWAVDKFGVPTTDPQKAIESQLLLPFSGHKGFGIAFLIDVLCSGFGNSYYGNEVYNIYEKGFGNKPGRVSHFFAAIQTDIFGFGKEFQKTIEGAKKFIHSSDLATGVDKVYFPGEKEWATKTERLKMGIPLPDNVAHELEDMASAAAINIPWK
ncbi:Ldh family oxidoreductase [Thermodesulfobacteriota bacterium]